MCSILSKSSYRNLFKAQILDCYSSSHNFENEDQKGSTHPRAHLSITTSVFYILWYLVVVLLVLMFYIYLLLAVEKLSGSFYLRIFTLTFQTLFYILPPYRLLAMTHAVKDVSSPKLLVCTV